MQMTITFRHMDTSQRVKDHVEEKMQKLDRFFSNQLVKSHVILSHEKFRYIAEVIITAENFTLTCSEEADDLYGAIDQVYHRVDDQCRRHKEKVKDHKSSRPELEVSVD